MDKKRILKAKEIVEYALKNDVSVKKACTEFGFGNTYVKNIKAKLIDWMCENVKKEFRKNK